MAWLLEYLVVVSCIVNVASADSSDYDPVNPAVATKLYGKLLTDYHPAVPPTHGGPVDVRMGFSIRYFDFLDETKQLATVDGWSYRVWNDSRLQWNKSEYNGTRKLVMDRNDIWVPDIVVQNSAKVTETRDANVHVFNTGTLRFYLSYQIDFLCEMNLKYFPYDEQECELEFSSVHYNAETINLTAREYVDSSRIRSAKDFQIKNFTVQRNTKLYRWSPYEYIDVTYTISLKRSAGAYTTKLVIPSVLTGFMVLATFLLPTASHEKITLCGMTFLCLLLLLTYLHLIVPTTGDTILGEYLCFALFVDFFATILAVVSYNVKVGVFPTQKKYDIMLTGKTEDGESEPSSHIPPSRKMQWLRYLDVGCFVLFSFIFVVGLAVILARRE